VKPNLDPSFVGIVENNPVVLRQISAEHLPGIINYICKNRGTVEEAKDVFQDALLICYDKAQDEKFELKGQFGGYLYGICRFLWLRKLKKKSNITVTTLEDNIELVDPAWLASQEGEERWQLFQEIFTRLGSDCQRVLQLFFKGTRLAAIAEEMGYTNTYVKLKKYQCKERLTKWIQSDERYQALKE